jgi:hypothetical protein
MNLNLPIRVAALAFAVGMGSPAFAQQYFNCEYSPRCEAIQNKQCAPNRALKDKVSLIRLHSSAEDVERTWAVLAGFETEYCSRLGDRGNIVREFVSFRAKALPKAQDGSCIDPLACAETFVRVTREHWQRVDLEAQIKTDLERASPAASKTALPSPPQFAAAQPIPAGSWQTTITATTQSKVATPAKVVPPGKTMTRTVQSQ